MNTDNAASAMTEQKFQAIIAALTVQVDPRHVCGRCRTPFGRSALQCPNETVTVPQFTDRADEFPSEAEEVEGWMDSMREEWWRE